MSDELISQFKGLENRFERFEDMVRLNGISEGVNDLDETVRALPAEIEAIRSRGYAFRSYLENKAGVLDQHWQDVRHRVERALNDERSVLREDYEKVERQMRLSKAVEDNPEKLESVLPNLGEALDAFERKVEAAERRVRDMFATLKKDADGTQAQINQINWFCDVRDAASFDFLANEALFLVATAEWVESGKGRQDPDGHLYLTDQRLIFEQDEKVGKKLGLFGGKQVQELAWEVPLHLVEGVEFENKGMFGGKDMLHFSLGSGAPYSRITLEVKGSADNKFWVAQINRMIAGETNDERAIQPDPEVVEALRNAPTECHVCGATLPMLVAGQMQVACEYCGSVIRV